MQAAGVLIYSGHGEIVIFQSIQYLKYMFVTVGLYRYFQHYLIGITVYSFELIVLKFDHVSAAICQD